MFSAKNIVLLTEINGFFDASLLHNYMDVIAICFYSKEWYIFVGGGLLERSRYDRCCKNADRKVSRKFKSIYCS
ncbi:hypothetical protein BU182_05650 [Enterococcus faecium]|nr:hypothetical protein BU182_05650 [Enterococcus faecium]OUK13607.1 hypothetical protein BU189_12815 [Enterococcus faecium]